MGSSATPGPDSGAQPPAINRRHLLAAAGGVAAGLALPPVVAAGAETEVEQVDETVDGNPMDRTLRARIGVCDDDRNPARGQIRWDTDGPMPLDLGYRSVGIEPGPRNQLNAVEIVPDGGVHGLTRRDFTVWVSNDNTTFTKIPFTFVDLSTSIWFLFDRVHHRYLKVACTREYTDAASSTFRLAALSTSVRAHGLGRQCQLAGGNDKWRWVTPLTVTNPGTDHLRDRAVHLSWADLQRDDKVARGIIRADLADVRFGDEAGRYLHAYADADGVWVRIADLPARASRVVLMLSGNRTAAPTVHHDTGALQVEYGARTITRHPSGPDGREWRSDLKVVRLGSGLLMAAAGTGGGGIGARYSSDEGRTWSEIETLIGLAPGRTFASTGSAYLDPATGLLLFFYYALGATTGPDWMNENDRSCHCMLARAETYDARGRPVFSHSQRLVPIARNLGIPSTWALTYTNPVRTLTDALVVPIAHVVERSAPKLVVSTYRSTDNGFTWVQNDHQWEIPGVGFEIGVSETAMIVRRDGSLLVYARKQDPASYYQVTTESFDDGVTWTPIRDSHILSSNTFPSMARDRDGHITLGWSGHNAQNQNSYHRNNLTSAWSDDEGATFHGYHDLLGASSHNVAGFLGGDDEKVRVVQSDHVDTGTHDRVYAWAAWSNRPMGGPHTMVVEDYEDYIHRSHGALDQVRYRDQRLAPVGSELGYGRWWRDTGHGTLTPGPGSTPTRSAVRLSALRGQVAAASRLFPAIKKGTVRVRVGAARAGAGIHLVLQEGLSNQVNARGTVASLRIEPDGAVRGTEDHTFSDEHRFGWCDDPNPATGNLKDIGAGGVLFALDYGRRSIGVDYGRPVPVTQLTLVDSDSTRAGRPGSRLKATDLTLWVSDTNQGHWRQVTGWTAEGGQGSLLTLRGPAVTARYVKVNQPYADNNFNFVNWLHDMLRTEPAAPFRQQYRPVGAGRVNQAGWTTVEIDVDVPGGRSTVRVDGGHATTFEQVHPAQAVTHLLIFAEGGTTGVDLGLDEFMVRDTSVPAPGLGAVFPSRRL